MVLLVNYTEYVDIINMYFTVMYKSSRETFYCHRDYIYLIGHMEVILRDSEILCNLRNCNLCKLDAIIIQ